MRARCFPPSTRENAMMPLGAISDPRLSSSAKVLIGALLYHALDLDWCTPTDEDLAAYLHRGRRDLRRALANLQQHGYIRLETVPATAENPTGRVIHLNWIYDPGVVPPPPDCWLE